MEKPELVKIEHLFRDYGDHRAVDDVSFSVRQGEVLGFLGPNGAGKTSTMQILSGNLAPSGGRVQINGIDLLDNPREAKRHIGYLPEIPPVYRELTVGEYLDYCGRLHGLRPPKLRGAVDRAAERCGLGEVLARLIGNLSKGYQQRVGIAQAIMHLPAVVILDEPTVGLDPIQIREIRGLIRELGRDHSVILSTHILPEVQSTCDRVQIIHQGRLVYSEELATLNARTQAESLLLGLRQTPEAAVLEAIEGVTAVEPLDGQRWRIRFAPEANPAEALAQAAVAQGWGLLELTPEQRSLEQVFVDLTLSEPSLHEEAAA